MVAFFTIIRGSQAGLAASYPSQRSANGQTKHDAESKDETNKLQCNAGWSSAAHT
uniref:Uncharacterized protein n=1 Tax=Anguilla anguilla TaxID=7936 RepID=A0A0E9P8D4_ANGAN